VGTGPGQRQNLHAGVVVVDNFSLPRLADQLLHRGPDPFRRFLDVLVAIVKKRLNLSTSLYEILQILSLTMFEKIPLDQLLAQTAVGENYLTPDNPLLWSTYVGTLLAANANSWALVRTSQIPLPKS
jgi:hypothetical protein